MKFTKRKTFITVITLMTAFAMTCTTAFAAIYRNNAIDENNYQITIRQGYEYGSNNGYTTKVTAERYNDSQLVTDNRIKEGKLVFNGKTYELNKSYTVPDFLGFEDNYKQLDPDDYFMFDGIKYSFHILSGWTPGIYGEDGPPQGEWMSYGNVIELIPAKMPKDVVFKGSKTIKCYVGDSIMSNQGITVDDNGKDLTSMVSGKKVDTSEAATLTYTWYITGTSGNQVEFTRTIIVQNKKTSAQSGAQDSKPAAKMITTTAVIKGTGTIMMSGPGDVKNPKAGKLYIKTKKGQKVTMKAKGKKFKYWQKKVGKKYKKYSKKKTIKVKATKNTTYRAVFKK